MPTMCRIMHHFVTLLLPHFADHEIHDALFLEYKILLWSDQAN